MAKQDEFIKTALRLPRDLHARIQLAAERTGRSMNAEIIHQLEMYAEGARVVDVKVHADGTFTLQEFKQLVTDIRPQLRLDDKDTLSISVEITENSVARK